MAKYIVHEINNIYLIGGEKNIIGENYQVIQNCVTINSIF